MLEVLYVELVKPPTNVHLDGLSPNVVPLTMMCHTIDARLPSDKYMQIKRNQVPVLPNFAMMDYSAQGKTREFNVIDLSNSKNFQAAYTALSRGTSLEGTIILKDFSDDKLTVPPEKESDGGLRQEYRELYYLDIITDLRYRGVLPEGIIRSTRWATIDKYRLWQGIEDDDIVLPTVDIDLSLTPINFQGKKRKQQQVDSRPTKRCRKNQTLPPRRVNGFTTGVLPTGLKWDASDYSCAYDSWVFLFFSLWQTDQERWSNVFRAYSDSMRALAVAFDTITALLSFQKDERMTLDDARDLWRSTVRTRYRRQFPPGTAGADIIALTGILLGEVDLSATTNQTQEPAIIKLKTGKSYHVCRMGAITDIMPERDGNEPKPDVMAINVIDWEGRVSWTMRRGEEYSLVGVIYFGDFHFVSQYISPDGKVFLHDGIRGRSSVLEGVLGAGITLEDLSTCEDRTASMVLYVKSSQ
jgi:hypothetical protein